MPKTLARSVIARAGMPSAAARATASSMRTIPSVMENSLWSRRWTKAGFGIGLRGTGDAKILPPAPATYDPNLTASRLTLPRIAAPELGVVGRGKAESESREQPRLAPYADPAAVQLGDRLHDGEAQARARRRFLARAARPIEAVEDARQVLRRDPRSGIDHLDLGRAVAARHRLHGDRAVRAAVAQRVGQEISHRAVEHQLVRPGARLPAFQGAHFEREADIALLREQLVVGEDLSQRLAQIDPLRCGPRLRVVGAGEKEHVLDHPREPLVFLDGGFQ